MKDITKKRLRAKTFNAIVIPLWHVARAFKYILAAISFVVSIMILCTVDIESLLAFLGVILIAAGTGALAVLLSMIPKPKKKEIPHSRQRSADWSKDFQDLVLKYEDLNNV